MEGVIQLEQANSPLPEVVKEALNDPTKKVVFVMDAFSHEGSLFRKNGIAINREDMIPDLVHGEFNAVSIKAQLTADPLAAEEIKKGNLLIVGVPILDEKDPEAALEQQFFDNIPETAKAKIYLNASYHRDGDSYNYSTDPTYNAYKDFLNNHPNAHLFMSNGNDGVYPRKDSDGHYHLKRNELLEGLVETIPAQVTAVASGTGIVGSPDPSNSLSPTSSLIGRIDDPDLIRKQQVFRGGYVIHHVKGGYDFDQNGTPDILDSDITPISPRDRALVGKKEMFPTAEEEEDYKKNIGKAGPLLIEGTHSVLLPLNVTAKSYPAYGKLVAKHLAGDDLATIYMSPNRALFEKGANGEAELYHNKNGKDEVIIPTSTSFAVPTALVGQVIQDIHNERERSKEVKAPSKTSEAGQEKHPLAAALERFQAGDMGLMSSRITGGEAASAHECASPDTGACKVQSVTTHQAR